MNETINPIKEVNDIDLESINAGFTWKALGGNMLAGGVVGGLGGAAAGGVGAVPGAIGGALLGGIGYLIVDMF